MLKPIEEEDMDKNSSSNASQIERYDMFVDDDKRMTLNAFEAKKAGTEKKIHSMNRSY